MKKLQTLVLLLCCFTATLYSSITNSEFIQTDNPLSTINSNGTEDLRPKLRIGFEAPQIDHRQILLTIDENSTDGFDWGYDAEIYEIFDDDMYWIIDQKKYVIQATNSITIGKEIPLGIQTLQGGDITIKVDSFENPIEGFTIYLKDKETDTLYDIQNNSFQLNLPAGKYLNRFVITFIDPSNNSVESECNNEANLNNQNASDNSKMVIFYHKPSSSIYVKNKRCLVVKRVNLFTSTGYKINTWEVNLKSRKIVLPVNVNRGVYLVQVKTKDKNFVKRIFINKF